MMQNNLNANSQFDPRKLTQGQHSGQHSNTGDQGSGSDQVGSASSAGDGTAGTDYQSKYGSGAAMQ
jgi:hypothetical protein